MASKWFTSICEARQVLGLISAIIPILRERKRETQEGGRRWEGEWEKEEKLIHLKALSWEGIGIQKDAHHDHPHKALSNSYCLHTRSWWHQKPSALSPAWLNWYMSWEGAVSQNWNKWCWEKEEANKVGRHTELVEQAPRFSRKQMLFSPYPSRSQWSLYHSNLRL